MKKAMTILYEVHGNLYVNLTNKCPCACTFCLRQTRDHMEESDSLWLEHDTTYEELVEALQQIDAATMEHYHKPVRINTNGLGSLINGEDIAPKLAGLVDTVSISLNTPDAEEYHKLVRSKFGDQSFSAMLQFAKECTKYVPHVVMTTVDTTISHEDEAACQKICDELGVKYRIRPWED